MDVQSMNEYPFNSVLLVNDSFGPQNIFVQGTGTLISPDEVLTANHVVYFNNGNPSDSVVATLNSFNVYTHPNGLPVGVNASPVGAQNIHYNPIEQYGPGSTLTDLADSTEANPQFDFAVIHLSTPLTANGYMGLSPDYAGGTVDVEGWFDNNNQLINDFETNNTLTLNSPIDGYNDYTGSATLQHGESGGPNYLFNLSTNLSSIVATNTALGSGQSIETAMTSQAVAEIELWLSQDGESPGVGRLYRGLLDRAPDTQGLATYSAAYVTAANAISSNPLTAASAAGALTYDLSHPTLSNNTASIVDAFLNSSEFTTANPNITNIGLVDLLYQQALGRSASGDPGATTWINDLNNGTVTREAVVIGIAESSEAITHAGIWGVPPTS